jgi:hypothetical protein
MLYQVIIQNECSKYPPPESHARTCLIMDCHNISKVPERLSRHKSIKNCVGEKSLHCQLEQYNIGLLRFPLDKQLKLSVC